MSETNENNLSANDEDILNCIFNANNSQTISHTCFHESKVQDFGKEFTAARSDGNVTVVNQLEMDGIQLAENGKLQEAIAKLTEAIEISSDRASLFNNRAQVYRLLDDDDAAMEDIQKAIDLSSEAKGDIFLKALCQRGIIHFKQRRDVEAVQDFQKAAALGSEFAKEQMVKLNPYAKLCNATLKKVFQMEKY